MLQWLRHNNSGEQITFPKVYTTSVFCIYSSILGTDRAYPPQMDATVSNITLASFFVDWQTYVSAGGNGKRIGVFNLAIGV